MKLARTLIIAAAMALAVPAAPAFADANTQAPNPSARFGQAGSAVDKLEQMNSFFGSDYDKVGHFMSDHVHSYSDVGPGRSAFAPNSENANDNADG